MTLTRDRLLQMVYDCIDELNENFNWAIEKSECEQLFGSEASLDSLGVVNFISLVEEKIQEEFGVQLSLAEEIIAAQERLAFQTVGELATFLAGRLQSRS
jgi:acyl carrier protein